MTRRSGNDGCRYRVEHRPQGLLRVTLGFLQAAPFRDILVNGQPAAVGGRTARDQDGTPAVQLAGFDRGLGQGPQALLAVGARVAAGVDAVGNAMVEQRADVRSRRGQLRGDTVHVGVALVANHQAALGIHHAQAMRHAG